MLDRALEQQHKPLTERYRHASTLHLVWRDFRRHPMGLVGMIILVAITLMSIFAFLYPYDPESVDQLNRFQPPSLQHPMGTDRSGRDVMARILYGGRVSLVVGIAAMATAVVIGATIGGIAGYYGGILDAVLMRLTDLALSFPSLFLLIMLSFLLREANIPLFQGGIASIALVIGLTSWMSVARLVRASFLVIKEQEFVTAARAYGASDARIMMRHMLPNAAGPLIVNATLGVAWAILIESGLSFLGFGIQPPTPSWGNILNDAQETLSLYPWLSIFPGLMIFLTVIAINYIGDALRDALDPYHVVERR
jgi:peptide/nickel transport system permease protein